MRSAELIEAARAMAPFSTTFELPSRRACPSTADKGTGRTHALPLSAYSPPGDLRQAPGEAPESSAAKFSAEARTCGNGSREMRVWLSTYGSRRDVGPIVGLAVQPRALGAEVRACARPDGAAT